MRPNRATPETDRVRTLVIGQSSGLRHLRQIHGALFCSQRVADLKPCARSGASTPRGNDASLCPQAPAADTSSAAGARPSVCIHFDGALGVPSAAGAPFAPAKRAVARARLDGSSSRHARRQVRATTHPPVPPGGSRGGTPPVPLPPPGCARRTAASPPLRRGIALAPRCADLVAVRLARGRSTVLGSARVAQAPHSRRDEAGAPDSSLQTPQTPLRDTTPKTDRVQEPSRADAGDHRNRRTKSPGPSVRDTAREPDGPSSLASVARTASARA